MIKVLFVCMGNICRSPTAEGVFRHQVSKAGQTDYIIIDSAGTHDYQIGSSPDRRAQQAALQRGYDLSSLRRRKVGAMDFHEFDYILAMDRENLANLFQICPPQEQHKLKLFMEFSRGFNQREVPDPYYGGNKGFENVLNMVEDAASGLLEEILARNIVKG
ncbi:MAG: phosphotyrosine protein phosphatase [Betaproteobacteria bacterium CG2_30_59_46]|nr:MAG: phosphotyrosine protein phosphatase [Betaproteobacteria bacterium CG2_30_59_46]PIQ11974.1 MAG: phosphotyrosine protein phosphatase [Hydrogenophilales bacterium CG18_big_fil_WC_8_21_14_2_50_58_12]PIY00368.1 MAG: phosphotyrosine protein phosphatase [Hydrogenophilales bacterium CG_4_10_14_3_um_filter_58_23]PJB07879.1 MAG: phosphotyrosine protein phosphatase [Hydrogenophilales bacterium CG_4_9_14_3_um_filter_59_35]